MSDGYGNAQSLPAMEALRAHARANPSSSSSIRWATVGQWIFVSIVVAIVIATVVLWWFLEASTFRMVQLISDTCVVITLLIGVSSTRWGMAATATAFLASTTALAPGAIPGLTEYEANLGHHALMGIAMVLLGLHAWSVAKTVPPAYREFGAH